MLRRIAFSLAVLAINCSLASPIMAASVVVDTKSCGKLSNPSQAFILVLNSDQPLLESISQCAKDAGLKGASISGLGQLHDPTLAYFTSNPSDKPRLTHLSGYYELASLNGNVSANSNNQYYTHAHAVLADQDFHAIAGHIDAAKVGMTVEITFLPLTAPVERAVDASSGFGPLLH